MAAPEQTQSAVVEGNTVTEPASDDKPAAPEPAPELDSLLALSADSQRTPANPTPAAAPTQDLLSDTIDLQPIAAPQLQATNDQGPAAPTPASPAGMMDLLGDVTPLAAPTPAKAAPTSPTPDSAIPAADAVAQQLPPALNSSTPPAAAATQQSPAVPHPLMATAEHDTDAAPVADKDSTEPASIPSAASVTSGSMSPQTVRRYLDNTVVPVLRMGLRELCVARPQDPFQFLADYILEHRPKQ